MNKILTKQVLREVGLPTGRFAVIRRERAEREGYGVIASELIREIGLPMVLKAPCEGSSIGVVIVREERDMTRAIGEILGYDDLLMAEEFLSGTEITLPILGNGELTVLPDIEITSERPFYDYTAKYTQGMCTHIIPARITENQRAAVRAIGQEAYRVLRCRGLARIDFIVDEIRGPMIIEVNTLPGMTEMSLFPDSARSAGISFPELAHKILSLCLPTDQTE
jgi:D-alanine-D-alanine ligase